MLLEAAGIFDGHKVTINGIAKGSGMIAPDMATLLAFVFTDANLPAAVLQPLVTEAAARSFNCITVDNDTSTVDKLRLRRASRRFGWSQRLRRDAMQMQMAGLRWLYAGQ